VLTVRGKPVAEVLGSFGKAVPGSVHLSLAPSGGRWCSRSCPHLPANGGKCYAERTERFRIALGDRLAAFDAAGPEPVAARAFAESAIRGHRFPWARVSAFGGVPEDPADVPSLVRLVRAWLDAGTPVHFPAETQRKADRWTRAIGRPEFEVRESVADPRRFVRAVRHRLRGVFSTVAGDPGDSRPERLRKAREVAERARALGDRVIVCPAVASRILRGSAGSAKCGACRACSDRDIRGVVFPLH